MAIIKEALSIIQLFDMFPSDAAATEWFENTRDLPPRNWSSYYVGIGP